METITAEHMRELERAAIESGAVTGLDLMERAGRGVVEAVLQEWPALAEGVHSAVVLCGPGNNGGDGFVVARLLRQRGWEVEIRFLGRAEKLPPDARANHDALEAPPAPLLSPVPLPATPPDLLVDALFGIGLSRPIDGALATFLAEQNTLAPATRAVAIDIPSGLDADSGAALGTAFRAALTVTFHRPKPGHSLQDGPNHCGKIAITDIGL